MLQKDERVKNQILFYNSLKPQKPAHFSSSSPSLQPNSFLTAGSKLAKMFIIEQRAQKSGQMEEGTDQRRYSAGCAKRAGLWNWTLKTSRKLVAFTQLQRMLKGSRTNCAPRELITRCSPLFDKTEKEQGRHILFCTEKGLRKRATGKRHLPQPEIYDPKMTLLRIWSARSNTLVSAFFFPDIL